MTTVAKGRVRSRAALTWFAYPASISVLAGTSIAGSWSFFTAREPSWTWTSTGMTKV